MLKTIIPIISIVLVLLFLVNYFNEEDTYNLKLEKLRQEYAIKPIPSVKHAKFAVLQKEFASPQEVTEACLSCHTERHKEIMNSSHWNWERVSYIEGRGVRSAGKKNVLNNFCIGSNTNEEACAVCHIGFGMTNDKFDFNNTRNVDCMVCHDHSDEYLKGTAMAGYPDRHVNLTRVAQSVGKPQRINCGSCHFYGGGGNNVKHGDLEEALLSTDRDVDVHMASNGMNMTCVDCHTAHNHQILGKLYSVSSNNDNRATCEQCHTNTPHFDKMLNQHTAKVSCQACHIPQYAKVNATKMEWRWSASGKMKDGEPFQETDSMGNITYLSTKGKFKWAKNVTPDYVWFNGEADHYIIGDTVKVIPVEMNHLFGSHDDPESKIVPVKIHYGDQIYDKDFHMMIQPKLYSKNVGDSAYWKDFDWDEAARAGMERMGLPYSGNFEFVNTIMYWPVNHMVAPASQSVGCAECHTRNNGRLASLGGFYLPGRDHNKPLDFIGTLFIIVAMAGVVFHAAIRIISAIRKKKYELKIIDFEQQP